MNLLLDTNIFIWLNDLPQRIPDRIMLIVTDPANNLSLSLVSVWEFEVGSELVPNPLSRVCSYCLWLMQW